MKNLLFILFAASTIMFGACGKGQTQRTNTNLTATEFAEKTHELSGSPVLDVRTPDEYSKGHLQGATNIDWNGNDFQKQVAALDKSKPVFIYCLSGGRSSAAANQMRSEGFKEVYELSGGIMKWRAANLPETTNSSASGGMSKQQFDALTNSNKMVLVDFYADWCAPCKKMKPYLDEISNTMADRLVLVRINADDNQQLCKELNIDGLPVLQLYKNKKLTWTNTGYIAKEDVLKQVQ
ncbi:MAG: thioredoxin domain-containing protein [Saprospiraceae bacterium]